MFFSMFPIIREFTLGAIVGVRGIGGAKSGAIVGAILGAIVGLGAGEHTKSSAVVHPILKWPPPPLYCNSMCQSKHNSCHNCPATFLLPLLHLL